MRSSRVYDDEFAHELHVAAVNAVASRGGDNMDIRRGNRCMVACLIDCVASVGIDIEIAASKVHLRVAVIENVNHRVFVQGNDAAVAVAAGVRNGARALCERILRKERGE